MFFDTHAHYDDKRFSCDLDELLFRMKENNVCYIVNAGCDIESSKKGIMFSEKFDFFYAAVGFHPGNIKKPLANSDLDEIASLCKHPKAVAIGEIGLDYHYDGFDKNAQKDAFSKQIALAQKLSLPIVIHSRDASRDTLDILKTDYKKTGAIWHCFGESVETARIALNMGITIAIGGTVTFKNNVRAVEAVKYIPLDMLVLETDAPYLAPVPHRGERNSSLYIHHVAEKIAEIKGVSPKLVEKVTTENAKKIYNIKT